VTLPSSSGFLHAGAARDAADVEGRTPLALAEFIGDAGLLGLLSHRGDD
jgi:hypothetical protein